MLRVLQEQSFERLGGEQTIKADLRVIAATNRDLEAMVRDGRFREDLYYRLRVYPIYLPPLRQRQEDIPALIEHLSRSIREKNHFKYEIRVETEAVKELSHLQWPGNVRDLKTVLTYLAVEAGDGSEITLDLVRQSIYLRSLMAADEATSVESLTGKSSEGPPSGQDASQSPDILIGILRDLVYPDWA